MKRKIISIMMAVGFITSVWNMAVEAQEKQSEEIVAEEEAEALEDSKTTVQAIETERSGTTGDLTWRINDQGHMVIEGDGEFGGRTWEEEIDCSDITTVEINATNMTDVGGMFYDYLWLDEVTVADGVTSTWTDISNMFYGCNLLETLDVSKWDTSNITNMSNAFGWCGNLTVLDVSKWDTSKVTDMSGIFYGCDLLETLDVSKWDTSNVTDMSNMFGSCGKVEIIFGDFDTSQVTDMTAMFAFCEFSQLDISKWDTSQVMNMSRMFYGCAYLNELNIAGWDTSKVTNMAGMFEQCAAISADLVLDLSGFDLKSITGEYAMVAIFEECYAKEIRTPLNLKLTNVLLPYEENNMGPCYKERWMGNDGKQYTTLPNDLSKSIVLTRSADVEHKYMLDVDKATLYKDGCITRKCARCGIVEEETEIRRIADAKLLKTDYTYNGAVQRPKVLVLDRGGVDIESSDYSVSYSSGCKKVGHYKAIITFKGNYSGTVTKTFNINPKGTKLSSVKAGKKKATVKWKKQAKYTKGYQVQYSAKKDFKSGVKTKTVKGSKKTSLVIKGLKSKKIYYVRIRTYQNVSGGKCYSTWSKAKKVKIK